MVESLKFTQHVKHHLTQSTILTAPITRQVKQHAEIAVPTGTKFLDYSIKQMADKNQNILQLPFTGRAKGSSRKSKDEKEKDEKNSSSHSMRKCSS